MIVVDSSAALAWTFADERNDATLAVAARVRQDSAVVPSLWKLEMANILRLAVRRSRISLADREAILADFDRLGFEVDDETSVVRCSRVKFPLIPGSWRGDLP